MQKVLLLKSSSPFRRTILVDADVVFLESPDSMWETFAPLREKGMLCFRDITLKEHEKGSQKHKLREEILSGLIRNPSSQWTTHSRIHRGVSDSDVESGVVFIDKKMHFCGVLVVAALNDSTWRGNFYRAFHGDKESFVLGLEAAGEDYHLSTFGAGIAGAPRSGNRVCGYQLAHVDPRNGERLMWWNQGLAKYKHHLNTLERAQLQFWAFEDGPDAGWDIHWGSKKLCVVSPRRRQFSAQNQVLINNLTLVWDNAVKKMSKIC